MSRAALLWDESFFWGLMAYDALRAHGVDFDVVDASLVRGGGLADYGALFVPGGWTSNKLKALGEGGARGIRGYVSSGGAYVGICGGAGLATREGLGLLDIGRRPLGERVPSLSGRVRVTLSDSPLWSGIAEPVFHVYWPSQFVVQGRGLKVLASFASAMGDAFSSDFAVEDMTEERWRRAEESYGINLNPAKMAGEPMAVEGACGRGVVLASLLHFDAPGCPSGSAMLRNICNRFGVSTALHARPAHRPPSGEAYKAALGLFEFGLRSFLWFVRPPVVLWRRGVRGFEYFTLLKMVEALAVRSGCFDAVEGMSGEIARFADTAKSLLRLEREALGGAGRMTFSSAPDPEVAGLRGSLFSSSKSYGGWFKELLDKLDGPLYRALREEARKV